MVLMLAAVAGCAAETSDPETTIAAQTTVGPATSIAGATTKGTEPATTSTTRRQIGPSTTILSPEELEPVVTPTLPADIPGYTELDPATGLHVTGTPQVIGVETYRLEVTGLVDKPLSLTYDELRLLPKLAASPNLLCPGFFVDGGTWSGASLAAVLDMAQVQAGAERISLVAADGYSLSVDLVNARAPDSFLAYEWNGEPLPALHGFPIRAVFPAKNGNFWVKWLIEIVVE